MTFLMGLARLLVSKDLILLTLLLKQFMMLILLYQLSLLLHTSPLPWQDLVASLKLRLEELLSWTHLLFFPVVLRHWFKVLMRLV